jgi:hypothetical protein
MTQVATLNPSTERLIATPNKVALLLLNPPRRNFPGQAVTPVHIRMLSYWLARNRTPMMLTVNWSA